jgi:hypothetical protein
MKRERERERERTAAAETQPRPREDSLLAMNESNVLFTSSFFLKTHFTQTSLEETASFHQNDLKKQININKLEFSGLRSLRVRNNGRGAERQTFPIEKEL